MAVADNAKTVTQVVQAFLWTLFAVVIVLFLISQSARLHVARMAKEANIKSVGEKGFEFGTVEEKSLQLVQENTQLRLRENPLPRNQDLKPDLAATALLTALQQANPQPAAQQGEWVYVGEYNEQKHSFRSPPNFDVTAPPAVGTTILSAQDAYMRDVKPYQDAKGTWQLGAIKGVLPKGKAVAVLETARIEGENQYDYNSWVRVRPQ
jgi:hypothetical protein